LAVEAFIMAPAVTLIHKTSLETGCSSIGVYKLIRNAVWTIVNLPFTLYGAPVWTEKVCGFPNDNHNSQHRVSVRLIVTAAQETHGASIGTVWIYIWSAVRVLSGYSSSLSN
jgi:hypothetical protein